MTRLVHSKKRPAVVCAAHSQKELSFVILLMSPSTTIGHENFLLSRFVPAVIRYEEAVLMSGVPKKRNGP